MTLEPIISLKSSLRLIEADAELKEEVKHLKSMLEQQAIQMAEQRRHFEGFFYKITIKSKQYH